MARNKFSGMDLEDVEQMTMELISKIESMGEEPHVLEAVKAQRGLADLTEMAYALQEGIPIENIENQFYGVSVHDIAIRYNDLVEELADMDDETPSSVFAQRYRELADCLEMIGDLEENMEG